jgi:hypothetical protein
MVIRYHEYAYPYGYVVGIRIRPKPILRSFLRQINKLEMNMASGTFHKHCSTIKRAALGSSAIACSRPRAYHGHQHRAQCYARSLRESVGFLDRTKTLAFKMKCTGTQTPRWLPAWVSQRLDLRVANASLKVSRRGFINGFLSDQATNNFVRTVDTVFHKWIDKQLPVQLTN